MEIDMDRGKIKGWHGLGSLYMIFIANEMARGKSN